jgi:hypothetical protein
MLNTANARGWKEVQSEKTRVLFIGDAVREDSLNSAYRRCAVLCRSSTDTPTDLLPH